MSGYTEVWVAAQNVPLIRFADRVRAISSTGLDLLGVPDVQPPQMLIETLRSFDSILSWYGANRPEFRAETKRLGLPFEFLTALPAESAGVHAADFFLAQAGGSAPAIPRIGCPAGHVSRPYAVIHPFSASRRKNWPLERFQEVACALARRMAVYWCAGPEEPLEGAARFSDLYELGCWLAGATVYLGNDSGISHLAAAVSTPIVVLFGPSDPRVWAPRGENVTVIATGGPGEPMDRIAVLDVLAALPKS